MFLVPASMNSEFNRISKFQEMPHAASYPKAWRGFQALLEIAGLEESKSHREIFTVLRTVEDCTLDVSLADSGILD